MNKIRKMIFALLAALLLLGGIPAALAAGTAVQDTMTGATFELPEGWAVESVIDEPERFRVTCSTGTGGMVSIASQDTWEVLSKAEKAAYGNDRANVNNSAMTTDIMADALGLEPGQVSLDTYGKHSFYANYAKEQLNGITYRWDTLICYWNGYVTSIVFAVPPDDTDSVKKLGELLDTFAYPGEEPAAAHADADPETWTCEACGAANDGNFCTNCGTKRPDDGHWTCPNCLSENDSRFCPNCGTPKP